jgi:hypothetical protein
VGGERETMIGRKKERMKYRYRWKGEKDSKDGEI